MNPSCVFHGVYFASEYSFKFSTHILAWINLTLLPPTVLLNTSLVIALLASKQRSKPCNLFLINLVITDTLSGYITIPFNFVFFYELSKGKDPCAYSVFLLPLVFLIAFVSFLAIFAIALERYIAIFFPYFYLAKANLRSTMTIITIIWIVPVISLITLKLTATSSILCICIVVIGVIGTVANLYCYYRILRFTQKIRQDISKIAKQFEASRYSKKESSLAITGAMMLTSMCFCYFPFFLVRGLMLAGYRSVSLAVALYAALILTTSNSLLNACITCYQLSHLWQAIKKLWSCKKSDGHLRQRVMPEV